MAATSSSGLGAFVRAAAAAPPEPKDLPFAALSWFELTALITAKEPRFDWLLKLFGAFIFFCLPRPSRDKAGDTKSKSLVFQMASSVLSGKILAKCKRTRPESEASAGHDAMRRLEAEALNSPETPKQVPPARLFAANALNSEPGGP